MIDIYEKLFTLYGKPVLNESGCCIQMEIEHFLSTLDLDAEKEVEVSDYLSDSYHRWSTNAFTLGLHLGLSLLNDNIRRLRPQEGQ